MKRPSLGGLEKRPRAAGGMALSPAEIRDLRGPRTRRAFGRLLGVSTATVYLWEAGRARPSADNRARLRRLLGRVRALGDRARIALRRSRARLTGS